MRMFSHLFVLNFYPICVVFCLFVFYIMHCILLSLKLYMYIFPNLKKNVADCYTLAFLFDFK